MGSSYMFQNVDAVAVLAGIYMTLPVQFVNTTFAVLDCFDELLQDRVFPPSFIFIDHILTGDVIYEHKEGVILVFE